MLKQQNNFEALLKRIDMLGREVEQLKRDLLHHLPARRQRTKSKPSLFGSVRGGDVTEEMIDAEKQSLFRSTVDLN